MLQGIAESGFKEELRFELVYDVAVGIGELAQHELQLALLDEFLCSRNPSIAPMRASVDIGSLRAAAQHVEIAGAAYAAALGNTWSPAFSPSRLSPLTFSPARSPYPSPASPAHRGGANAGVGVSFRPSPNVREKESACRLGRRVGANGVGPAAPLLNNAESQAGNAAPCEQTRTRRDANPHAVGVEHRRSPAGPRASVARALFFHHSSSTDGSAAATGFGGSTSGTSCGLGTSLDAVARPFVEAYSTVAQSGAAPDSEVPTSCSAPPTCDLAHGTGTRASTPTAVRTTAYGGGVQDSADAAHCGPQSLRSSPQRPRPLLATQPLHTHNHPMVTPAACSTPRPPMVRSQSEGTLSTCGIMLSATKTQARSAATHYELERFRRIRAHFGVTPATYALAFPDDLSTLGSSWRTRLKESVSEGASGAFFYRVLQPRERQHAGMQRGATTGQSRSYEFASRFIVKQITPDEKRTLMAILPAYEEYIGLRKGASLIAYFGCHSMSLRWRYSGKVYFVVMRNFLPVSSWLTFDLKGATANRRALAAHALHRIHAQAGEPSRRGVSAAYGTLRDWEWLDIAMAVDIPPNDKARLSEIIRADAAFLKSQGVMDYSLLVGIHRLDAAASVAEREATLSELIAQGGYSSSDRQRIYFFGIIDVLERYTLRWKIQRLVLTAGYHSLLRALDADGISALPPAEYADRFCTFVHSEVLHMPYDPHQPVQMCAPLETPPNTPQLSRTQQHGSSSLESSVPEPHPSRKIGANERLLISPAKSRLICLGSCARRCGCMKSDHAERDVEDPLGLDRWGHLWQRRRRGLVQERIDGERADQQRRIHELETSLQRARQEAAAAAQRVATSGGLRTPPIRDAAQDDDA